MSFADGRTIGFAVEHPLVVVFVALEVLFFAGGFLLDVVAKDVAPGATTSLAHVAGIMGALGIVFAGLGVVAIGGYVSVFRFRR